MQVDGASSGLEVVMRQWTMHQGDVSGSYNIKLTTTGLLRVLQVRSSICSTLLPFSPLLSHPLSPPHGRHAALEKEHVVSAGADWETTV